MIIYNLIHVYKSTDCYHDIKNLGYYSSYENAYEAIEYYKETQGFCDNKNGFAIVPYNVDSDLLNLQVVYDVYVYIHDDVYDYEYTQLLGILDKRDKANTMVELFKQNNRLLFLNNLKIETEIDETKIDELQWKEGFTSDD